MHSILLYGFSGQSLEYIFPLIFCHHNMYVHLCLVLIPPDPLSERGLRFPSMKLLNSRLWIPFKALDIVKCYQFTGFSSTDWIFILISLYNQVLLVFVDKQLIFHFNCKYTFLSLQVMVFLPFFLFIFLFHFSYFNTFVW